MRERLTPTIEGLMLSRHYGFLANHCRKAKLAQIRIALALMVQQIACTETDEETSGVFGGYPCSKRRIGRLLIIGFLAPPRFEGG